MILYHGSNCEIDKIDLSKCKPFKDFGQSFYLTTILHQAQGLHIKEFPSADKEWAEFVMANRSRANEHPADAYDLIIGPVANDDIATLFRTFSMGIIAIDDLVKGLKFRKLSNQYAFRTVDAISLLQRRGTV